MIEARVFIEAARRAGFDWYAGVPCSYLTPFINYVIGDASLDYFAAANEGDAVAAAAGASLGGRGAVVMMQNSGLGNAVSPLTSLSHVFGIPVLLICTHRGAPDVPDEPQHALMGTITLQLLDTMQIPHEAFPDSAGAVDDMLERARVHFINFRRPYALVMPKGAVAPFPLPARSAYVRPSSPKITEPRTNGGSPATRAEALRQIVEATPPETSIVIATTGYTGRELYAMADRDNHFYMVGSMGCASSFAQGLALARPDLHVVVIDGDGAALMRMGNFATAGFYRPANLSHVLFDNGVHESTGGQASVSPAVDFPLLAAACGYGEVWRGSDVDTVGTFLARPRHAGPGFLHLGISSGTLENLPRPAITPPEVLARLRQHLGLRG